MLYKNIKPEIKIKTYHDQVMIDKARKFCTPLAGPAGCVSSFCIIAEYKKEIIGAITADIDHTFVTNYRKILNKVGNSREVGTIIQIAVKEEFKRTGLSKELLDEFEKECLKKKATLINTTDITGGERMYKFLYKNGFTKVLLRKEGPKRKLDQKILEIINEYCDSIGKPKWKKDIGKHLLDTRFMKIGLLLKKDEAILRTFKESLPIKNIKGGPKEIKIKDLDLTYEKLIKRLEKIFKQEIL